MPRERENTRVKDLPDIALLATTGPYDAHDLLDAFTKTFKFRNTHEVPAALPAPSAKWAEPYARMAQEDGLKWATIEELVEAVRAFIDPVLSARQQTWDPATWTWRETR